MSIRDEYNFSIIENTMKERVIDTLENEFETSDESFCRCDECVIDIVCYALNRLTPNYSASLYGALYSRANADHKHKDIEEKVREAIDFVASNASHSKK